MAIDSSLSEVDRAILEREAPAQSRSHSGPSEAYQVSILTKIKKGKTGDQKKKYKGWGFTGLQAVSSTPIKKRGNKILYTKQL